MKSRVLVTKRIYPEAIEYLRRAVELAPHTGGAHNELGTLLLERRDLDAVRREKGRLRSYLLTSLKHFLANERDRAMAIKRGAGQRLIPLEDLRERERVGFGPSETLPG